MKLHRIGPAIVSRIESPAELAQRAADAADWGHCLDCGAPCDALAGEVQCAPCDALAAELDDEREQDRDALALRIIAEAERLGPFHSGEVERFDRRAFVGRPVGQLELELAA